MRLDRRYFKRAAQEETYEVDEPSQTRNFDGAPSATIGNRFLVWYLEFFAIFISIGCVIAIAVLLRKMDGQPLMIWTFSVSFNTVIAILGTICRTTLAFAVSACIGQQKWSFFRRNPGRLSTFEVFDQATRGPLGASRLMFHLNIRHWASLGALVTVGSLVFDPFLQASIGNVGILETSTSVGRASIGRVTRLDFGSIIKISSGFFPLAADGGPKTSAGSFRQSYRRVTADLGFASAAFNAFYNTSAPLDRPVSFACETGNCTWAPYNSLGVCSTCADVSKYLVQTTGRGKNGSNSPYPNNVGLDHLLPWTNYSLPYGSLSNYDDIMFSSTLGGFSTGLTVNTTTLPSQSISFKESSSLLISILMIRGAAEWIRGNVTWNVTTPVATECALYVCSRTYESNVIQGILEEKVKGSWAQRRDASYQTIVADDDPNLYGLTIAKGKAWTAEHPELYDIEVLRTDLQISAPTQNQGPLEVFNATQASLVTMISILFEAISGDDVPRAKQVDFPGGFRTGGRLSGPLAFAGAIFQWENINAAFDQVAQRLTTYLRSANATMASPGFAQDWVLYVEVNWGFFALPFVSVVLGSIYVFLSIFESSWLHIPVWTNDLLPTLMYGLNEDAQNLLRPVYGAREGAKKAGNRVVQFSTEKDRLQLIS